MKYDSSLPLVLESRDILEQWSKCCYEIYILLYFFLFSYTFNIWNYKFPAYCKICLAYRKCLQEIFRVCKVIYLRMR